MVGDKTKQKNSGELETSLAPAEAEVGAVAKAEQKKMQCRFCNCFIIRGICKYLLKCLK